MHIFSFWRSALNPDLRIVRRPTSELVLKSQAIQLERSQIGYNSSSPRSFPFKEVQRISHWLCEWWVSGRTLGGLAESQSRYESLHPQNQLNIPAALQIRAILTVPASFWRVSSPKVKQVTTWFWSSGKFSQSNRLSQCFANFNVPTKHTGISFKC